VTRETNSLTDDPTSGGSQAPPGGGPGDPPDATTSRDRVSSREEDLQGRLRVVELKLRGIEAISRALVSEHNLERILEAVMERTTGLLSADRATLYMVGDDEERLWSKVTQGEDVQTIELAMGQGIAGWVAKYGRAVNVKDAYKDPRFDRRFDEEFGYRTKSVLACPLRNSRQHVIGVIQVLNKAEGYFTPADEDLLGAIASQAAISIQNSKLYLDIVGKNIDLLETQMRLRERTAELELLFGIERAAATATTRDGALEGVLDATLVEFPCEVGAVVLLDRYRDLFRYEFVRGPERERLRCLSVGVGGTVAGEVLRSGQSVSVAGRHRAAEELPIADAGGGWQVRTLACVPIINKGQRLGVLQLINRTDDPRGFRERELRLLEMIAGRMALSLIISQVQEEEQKEERLATIGQMLSGVVHDLKTPLTIINGYAQLAARDVNRALGEDPQWAPLRQGVDGYKGLIQQQIAQIKAMTGELLAFARGESQVLLRKVHLSQFLKDLAVVLEEEFSGSGVALVIEPLYAGAARFDENKLRRAIFNLARNAREAMGGEGEFRIRVEREGDEVVLTFADTGPGIPDEMEGRLFESFATYGKENGTGLGLAIVKAIVDEHHGTIEVTSRRGEGTTFTLRLPAG
jgi:signal transduction histidine kinase